MYQEGYLLFSKHNLVIQNRDRDISISIKYGRYKLLLSCKKFISNNYLKKVIDTIIWILFLYTTNQHIYTVNLSSIIDQWVTNFYDKNAKYVHKNFLIFLFLNLYLLNIKFLLFYLFSIFIFFRKFFLS